MLKAVLFDFDGTVGNTLPLCIAAFQKAITPLAGRSFSEREIVATFGPSEEGTIRALIPHSTSRAWKDICTITANSTPCARHRSRAFRSFWAT